MQFEKYPSDCLDILWLFYVTTAIALSLRSDVILLILLLLTYSFIILIL